MTTAYLPIFVYGTLMYGHDNYERLLAKAKPKVVGATLADHVLLVPHKKAHFPYMVTARAVDKATKNFDNDSGYVVKGELMYLPKDKFDHLLGELDWLEGHPDHYRRQKVVATVRVPTKMGVVIEQREAWTYVLPDEYVPQFFFNPVIESGSWAQHVS